MFLIIYSTVTTCGTVLGGFLLVGMYQLANKLKKLNEEMGRLKEENAFQKGVIKGTENNN